MQRRTDPMESRSFPVSLQYKIRPLRFWVCSILLSVGAKLRECFHQPL